VAIYQILLLGLSILAAYAGFCYLDSRFNMRLVDWINGQCANPFKFSAIGTEAFKSGNNKEQEIQTLKARIATLEKIVTEPAYELNQKLNSLK
jgi:cell shape-determining protein MreC